MARSTFTLLGIFLVITIAAAAIVPEPIPPRNITKRSELIKTVKSIGGSILDSIDNAVDFLTGGIFRPRSIYPAPETVNSIDNLRDAILRKDFDTMIDILIKKNFYNREIIASRYEQEFHRDLIPDLTDNFEGPIRDLFIAYVTKKYEFYAQELRNGIHEIFHGSKSALFEIFCNPDFNEISEILRVYDSHYETKFTTELMNLSDVDLRDSIMKFVRGHKRNDFVYQPLMFRIITYRKDDPYLDELMCTLDSPRFFADHLHSSLVNEDVRSFNRLIILLANHDGYESVMYAYEKFYRQSLKDAIYERSHGPYREAVLAIIDMATRKMNFDDVIYTYTISKN